MSALITGPVLYSRYSTERLKLQGHMEIATAAALVNYWLAYLINGSTLGAMTIDLSGDFLSGLVELGYQQAERIILERNSELLTLFLIIAGDGSTEILAAPWVDELQKMVMLQAIRIRLRKTSAVAYSVVAEAWASAQPTGWKEGDPHVPASEAANRVEKVMCYAVGQDGQKKHGSWTIQRDENGKAVALVADKEAVRVEGRLVSLFE